MVQAAGKRFLLSQYLQRFVRLSWRDLTSGESQDHRMTRTTRTGTAAGLSLGPGHPLRIQGHLLKTQPGLRPALTLGPARLTPPCPLSGCSPPAPLRLREEDTSLGLGSPALSGTEHRCGHRPSPAVQLLLAQCLHLGCPGRMPPTATSRLRSVFLSRSPGHLPGDRHQSRLHGTEELTLLGTDFSQASACYPHGHTSYRTVPRPNPLPGPS